MHSLHSPQTLSRTHLNYGIALFILLSVVYIALIFVPRQNGHLIGSDGAYYYSYLRSMVLDGDFDIANDVDIYNSRMAANNNLRIQENYSFSIGPAVLWLPFFTLAHGVTIAAGQAGLLVTIDGYSYGEEAAVCLGSIFYMVLGLLLLFHFLSGSYEKPHRMTALTGILLASPLIYYSLAEPFMSHAVEFFSTSLFLWLVLPHKKRTTTMYLAIGMAAGLVYLVRWQNSVLWLLVPWLLWNDTEQGFKDHPKKILCVVAGLLPVMLVQSLFWLLTMGRLVTVPQGSGFLTLTSPHFFQVLFSFRHGLFIWHPLVLIGLAGLAFFYHRTTALVLTVIFIFDVVICGMPQDWWAGHAFGMRRLVGMLPLAIIGLTALLGHLRGKARKTAVVVVLLLILWNGLSILQYKLRLIPADRRPSLRELTIGRLMVPVEIGKLLKDLPVQQYPRGW